MIDCTGVREYLSAYYDAELPLEKRGEVGEHLKICPECAEELEGLRRLSILAGALPRPKAADELWDRIVKQLDAPPSAASHDHSSHFASALWRRSLRSWWGLSAAAAVLLLAVTWGGYRTRMRHDGDHEFAAVFDRYLDEFHRRPRAAQQLLLAKYEGREIGARDAQPIVGYRPAVVRGVPEGYAMESTYILKMPCCTCVQCVCVRSDGTSLVIFEHNEEGARHGFGNRPQLSVACSETPCDVVEFEDRIAATWKHNRRYLTVIGARDTAEVGKLAAWFEEGSRLEPP